MNISKPTALVIGVDIVLINLLYAVFYWIGWVQYYSLSKLFLMAVFYIIVVLLLPPFAQNRFVRTDEILGRTLATAAVFFALMATYAIVEKRSFHIFTQHVGIFITEAVISTIIIFYGRYGTRELLKYLRSTGRNIRKVVFIGAGRNLNYLYKVMQADLSTGYRVLGYFSDQDSAHLPENLIRLGVVKDSCPWLHEHRVDEIYCNLPSERSQEILHLMNICDKRFIHFYSVPNVHNYVHRSMQVEMLSDMPVLTLRPEPLRSGWNRAVKRAFDILFSGLFIVCCYWWIFLIVALITKLTMPGPVLFRQKRNGIRGEEFECLKFRSMKVNSDADRLQATKNDPRKTKWGNFMRKTSIDELPQFINVFRGEMSVVGPRPHMVKHTREYSALIDKYMVRHWVKPGITGWAQVTGARGETQELWQMEDRIEKDVWYVENWSMWLDLRIIYMTVRNAIRGDQQAY